MVLRSILDNGHPVLQGHKHGSFLKEIKFHTSTQRKKSSIFIFITTGADARNEIRRNQVPVGKHLEVNGSICFQQETFIIGCSVCEGYADKRTSQGTCKVNIWGHSLEIGQGKTRACFSSFCPLFIA